MAKDLTKIIASFGNDVIKEGAIVDNTRADRVLMGSAQDFLETGLVFSVIGAKIAQIEETDETGTLKSTAIPMLLCVSSNGGVFQMSSTQFTSRGTDYGSDSHEKVSPISLCKAAGVDETTLVSRDLCGCKVSDVGAYLMTTYPQQKYKVVGTRTILDSANRERLITAIVFEGE